MNKNKKKETEEISFWQSHADMLTALVLVLLLIIAILAMYLMRQDEYDDYHPYETTEYYKEESDNYETTVIEEDGHHEDYTEPEHEDNSGGGGGGDGEDETRPTEEGDMPDEGDGIKSAVYAILIDGETEKSIKEAGVEFELYDTSGQLKILNTYYPEKITYKKFETTEDGSFYLPEKIWERGYYFRNLTEATGYDIAEDVYFDFDQMYDWPDPLIVKIPVFPSRNIIKVQMLDNETGQSVKGGSFNVIAQEDILTQDGTLRYTEGEIVDTIEIGDDGYGESEELFLGEYKLVQGDIPEYYASQLDTVQVTVTKRTDTETETNEIQNEKTKIQVSLVDELYPSTGIAEATFRVSDGNKTQDYVTDKNGRFEITDIAKDTDYTIEQLSTQDGWYIMNQVQTVQIPASGRDGDSSIISVDIENRAIRVSVGLYDAILGRQITDRNIKLLNESDETIKEWITTSNGVVFTDIPVGTYDVVIDDDIENPYSITIQNVKEVQTFQIKKIVPISIIILVLGFGIIVFGICFVFTRIRKKHKSNNTNST